MMKERGRGGGGIQEEREGQFCLFVCLFSKEGLVFSGGDDEGRGTRERRSRWLMSHESRVGTILFAAHINQWQQCCLFCLW